jgi:hypothetical protein
VFDLSEEEITMARKSTGRRTEEENIRDFTNDTDEEEDEENPERWKEKEGFEVFDVESEADEDILTATDPEPPIDDNVIDAETNAEVVMDEIDDFTSDEDVEEDFRERQRLNAGGSKELDEKLRNYTSETPDLSADDIDAGWDAADQSGEETVGGTNPTPDQDQVEELGEAFGISYDEDEPLNTEDKLQDRDLNRWELNPASALPSEDEETLTELDEEGELEEEDVDLYLEDLLEEEEAEEAEEDEDYYLLNSEDEGDEEEDEFDEDIYGEDDDEYEDLIDFDEDDEEDY